MTTTRPAIIKASPWEPGKRADYRVLALCGLLLPYVASEPAPVDALLLAGAAFWLIRGVARTTPLRLWWLCAFVGLELAALWVGNLSGLNELSFGLRSIGVDAYFGLTLVALLSWFRASPFARFHALRWYVVGAAIAATLVLALQVSHLSVIEIYRDDYASRLKGTFKDPNVLAPFLIVPALALLGRKPITDGLPFRRTLGVLCCVVIFETYSRGAYVAFLVALFVLLWDWSGRGSHKLRQQRRVLLVAGAVIGGVVLISVAQAFESRSSGFASTRFREQSYDTNRFALIRSALPYSLSHPFGTGPGAYGLEFGQNPHNLLAGQAVEGGILTALIVAVIYVKALKGAAARRKDDPVMELVYAGLAGHLVLSMVIYSHHWRHLLLLLVLGLAGATRSNQEEFRSAQL